MLKNCEVEYITTSEGDTNIEKDLRASLEARLSRLHCDVGVFEL